MPNNFFNIFENILCLSLKESINRRQHIESEFASVGIKKYKIIDAINQNDPKVLKMYKKGLVKKYPPCFRCGKSKCDCENNILIPQQVANFLSHRKIWEYIIEKDFKCALIVEDDIKFTDYYKNVINDLRSKDYFSAYNITKDSESLIRLGWAKCAEHNPKMKTALVPNLLRMSNPCYFITNGMAKKLIDNFKAVNTTSDIFIHDVIGKTVNNLTLIPPIAYELSYSTGEFKSLIHPKEVYVQKKLAKKSLDAFEALNDFNNHIKKAIIKDVLLTGHPRCGSKYMSELFKTFGLDVGHELMGARGISSWMFAVYDWNNPYALNAYARSRYYTSFKYVVHYVRDPRAAIPSIIRENAKSVISYRFRNKHIKNEVNRGMDDYPDELSKAIFSFIEWNKIVQQSNPDLVAKVEECEDLVLKFCIEKKLVSRSLLNKLLIYPSKSANSDKLYLGEKVEKPKLSISIWNNISIELKKQINEFCTQYDYPKLFNTEWKYIDLYHNNEKPTVKTIKKNSGVSYEKSSDMNPNLIFLISQPRSGSTLLQRILGANEQVHTVSEPWIMLQPLFALKEKGMQAKYEWERGKNALQDLLNTVPEKEALYYRAVRAMGEAIYSRLLETSGKTYFLDKTPRYYLVIPELIKTFPEAKFVFILRNPLAVLSSTLSSWFGNDSELLRRSKNYMDLIEAPALILDGIYQLRDKAIVTHYEDLVTNPEVEIERVCLSLHLPFHNSMIEYGNYPKLKGRFGDQIEINQHNKPVKRSLEKWKTHLNSDPNLRKFAIEYIKFLGVQTLSEFGYSYSDLLNDLESSVRSFEIPDNVAYGVSSDTDAVVRNGFMPEKHNRSLNDKEYTFSYLNEQEDTDAAKKMYGDAQILVQKGIDNAAIMALVKLLESYPDFAIAHNDLGVLYYKAGKKEDAFEHYMKAAKLQPENVNFQKNLADFYYFEQGEIEKAMKVYVNILGRNPKDVETLIILGNICIALKKFEDAKIFYSRGLEVDPGNKDAMQNLKKIQAFSQDYKHIKPLPIDINRGNNSQDITESDQYLVSAIVSTYNSERFIRGCLEDLEDQTISDKLEIIVVDSNSQQGEHGIVNEMQKRYGNIVYIRTAQRETIYKAWNRGIRIAKGRYITNANTDDRHRKDSFEILSSLLRRNPEIAIAYGDQIITETANESFEKNTAVGYFFWPDYERNYLLKVCCIGPQPMWRKSIHEEMGYFDESLRVAGDYEFWLRITQRYSAKHIPEILGLYYRSRSNAEYVDPSRTIKETTLVKDKYRKRQLQNEFTIKGKPLVSIIIPTYNRPEKLENALNSVALQTYREIEAIVINDGGEDVQSVIGKFKDRVKVKLINHEKNKDRSAARNTGLLNANGKYIGYLDDDDLYHFDHIENALKILTNTNYKITYSDAYRAHQMKIGERYHVVRRDIPYSIDYQSGRFLKTNITPILCVVHEKSLINDVGAFDQSLPVLEDWDLWIRMSLKYDFYHIKKVTCEFTWRYDGSTTTSSKTDKFDKYRTIIINKYINKSSNNKEGNAHPLVSIIVLTYNQLEYTKKCLESIAANTPEPHEIIVVDNGSTDGTVEYLDSEIISKESRFKVIKNKENLGFALGNNKGIAEAKGDYIVLMNNDVVVTPGWLKLLVEVAQKKPQIGIVGPMSNYVSGPQLVKEVSYQKASLKGLKKFSQTFARKHEGETMPYWRVVGFCMLIKREVIDKIGGLDGRFGLGNFEDDDFSLRAALAGFESWIVKDCFVHHFGSRTFAGAKIDFRESLHKNWEIFKEKWGIPRDVAYGASYDMGAVVRNGFIPEKHYCPLSDKEYTSPYSNKERQDTDAAKKMYENVQILVEKGMDNAAIMAFGKLLESYPDFALAHNDLGVLYYKAGKKEDAFEHYKKAAKLQPENINFQKNLADFYYVELGKVQEAMEIYVKILSLNPRDIECLLMLGHISVSIEKIDDAKVFYSKVLEIDPGNVDAKQNLDSIQTYEQGTAV